MHPEHIAYNFKVFNNSLVSVQVWKLWLQNNQIIPVNATDVMHQMIWYNQYIKWGNTHLFITNGMIKIKDIVEFCSFQTIINKFGQIKNIVTRHRLIASIPRLWKNYLTKISEAHRPQWDWKSLEDCGK